MPHLPVCRYVKVGLLVGSPQKALAAGERKNSEAWPGGRNF
jgi:hypothetical protein